VLATFVRVRDDRAASTDLWRAGILLGLACSPVRDDVRTGFRTVRAESLESMRSSLASVRASAGLPAAARHVRDVVRLQSAAADGLFLATETARPWNLRRLTESVGRALAAVALAGDVRSPRSRPVDVSAPRPPLPVDDSLGLLLIAATEIASKYGYAGTTVSLVCSRAGLSPSSLYRQVAGKDALIAAVVEHSFVEWLDAQPTWTLATTEGERVATLRRVVRASVAMSRATPAFLRIGHLVSLEAAGDGTAARTQFNRIRRQAENSLTAWFAGTFRATPAFADRELSRTLARAVLVLTDGLFLADQLGEGPGDDVADLVVAVLETIVRQRTA
jgi:AcrR family transcriptional regulator